MLTEKYLVEWLCIVTLRGVQVEGQNVLRRGMQATTHHHPLGAVFAALQQTGPSVACLNKIWGWTVKTNSWRWKDGYVSLASVVCNAFRRLWQ